MLHRGIVPFRDASNVFLKSLLWFQGVPRGEQFSLAYDYPNEDSMRKSVVGIFTVAALAASVTFDVAAAQRGDRSDGSRGASAATSGGAAVSQPPPSGPGKLPSAGEIPKPTSAASQRVDTPAPTWNG